MRRIYTVLILAMLALFGASPRPAFAAKAADAREARDLVVKARMTLGDFLVDRNYPWFQENLQKAKAVLIFPEVLKAGFFWGGSGGTGVLSVRDEKTGAWSQPAFYTVGSVSFGLQIGAESAEVIMLAMSRKAIDSLYASSVKLGGDVAVAAGPYGAGVNKVIPADFISFAKTKGLYAGLDFEGSALAVRDSLNKAYYGREVRPIDIVLKKEVSNPDSSALIEALSQSRHESREAVP